MQQRHPHPTHPTHPTHWALEDGWPGLCEGMVKVTDLKARAFRAIQCSWQKVGAVLKTCPAEELLVGRVAVLQIAAQSRAAGDRHS